MPSEQEVPTEHPYWLTSYEDFYPQFYDKPGVSYSLPSTETNFNEDTILVAKNDSELAAHLATAQSNDNIQAIYLDADTVPWPMFHWPVDGGTEVNRVATEALVIRSHPTKSRARIQEVTWNQEFSGFMAFIDLQANFNITGGGEGLLIEKCIGSVTARGANVSRPIGNVLVRLCNLTSLDTRHYYGFLAEGNVVKGSMNFAEDGLHGIARYNVVGNASLTGVRFSSGGRLYDNLILNCPIGVQLGFAGGTPSDWSRSWRNIFIGTGNVPSSLSQGIAHYIINNSDCFVEDNLMVDNTNRGANGWHSCVHFDNSYSAVATVARNNAKQWYGSKGPLTDGGTGIGNVIVNGTTIKNWGESPEFSSNNFDCTISSAAQTIIDTLASLSYVDNLQAAGVGISPIELQSMMFTIFQGVS